MKLFVTVAAACAALALAGPARAASLEPVAQTSHSVGIEIEGMLTATKKSGTLKEKAEYVQNATKSYGLPLVTYELDQIDATTAAVATAEIVTAPFDATEAGLGKLLTAAVGAYTGAPTKAITFTPSADFGGTESTATISKGRAAGSMQVNLTIPAGKLVPDTELATKTIWETLVPVAYAKKVIPLANGARAIAAELVKDGGALHANAAHVNRVRLWVLLWLQNMTAGIGKGSYNVAGYSKDYFGCTIKAPADPASSGLPADAATTVNASAAAVTAVSALAKAAVAASLGVKVSALQGWPEHPLSTLANADAATERPLAARLVGTAQKLAPIVELRRSNGSINAAFRDAIDKIAIKKSSTVKAEATKLKEAIKDLQ